MKSNESYPSLFKDCWTDLSRILKCGRSNSKPLANRKCVASLGLGLTLILIGTVSPATWAQTWPSKPIHIVVPFPAAGTVDAVARALGQKLGDNLKQVVIVDNKPGAGANIGADAVAKSAPDGYNLLLTTQGLAIAPNLYKKMPFDAQKDLSAVSQLMTTYLVLAVNPSIGVNSFSEFINLARAKPGVLNFGSTGEGAAPHLIMELLMSSANIKLIHIPYKGDAPMNQALLAGDINAVFSPLSGVSAAAKAGKLKILVMSAAKRSSAIPDIPTMLETGPGGFEYTGWLGLFAAGATPMPILKTIQVEFVKAMNSPEIKEKLPNWGYEAVGTTPEAFTLKFQQDLNAYSKTIKDAHISLQDQ
jgi:tripartite-type tricarboxylate transporter receptor subunit TctC